MDERDLREAIERLEQRVGALERLLAEARAKSDAPKSDFVQRSEAAPKPPPPPPRFGPTSMAAPRWAEPGPTATPAVPPSAPAGAAQSPVTAPSGPTTPPAPSTAPAPVGAARVEWLAPEPPSERVAPTSAPIGVPAPPPPKSPVRSAGGSPIEMLIGGRWMAWVGALVVVGGMIFFLKYAYDRGWLGQVPPIWRCVLSSAFGFALLGAGEFLLRRIGRPAAVALYAAGIGVLYATAYAAHKLFGLVGELGDFVLLGVVGLIGIAVTLRSRSLAVGVLSLIAAALAPILVQGATQAPVALPLHLTMMLGVSLAAAYRQPRPLGPMRVVGGIFVIVLATWWVVRRTGGAGDGIGAAFLGIWWAMVVAESLISALAGRGRIGNAAMTIGATAAAVTLGCVILPGALKGATTFGGISAITYAGVAAALAAMFGPGVEGLRRRPVSPIETLAVALWAQSGVLVAVAAALQFRGMQMSLAWLAVAVAAIETGRRLRSRGIDVFGLVVLAISTVKVAALDSWNPALRGVWVEFPGSVDAPAVTITLWCLEAATAVAGITLAAWRIRVAPGAWSRLIAVALTALATLVWMELTAVATSGWMLTLAWLIPIAAYLAAERPARRLGYLGMAMTTAAATLGLTILSSGLEAFSHEFEMPPGFSGLLDGRVLAVLALVAAVCWAGAIVQRRVGEHDAESAVDAPDVARPMLIAVVGLLAGCVVAWFQVTALISEGWERSSLWLLAPLALLLAERRGRRLMFLELAMLALAATAGQQVIAMGSEAFERGLESLVGWAALRNPMLLVAAATAAAGWWAARIATRREGALRRPHWLQSAVLSTVFVFVFVMLSIEIDAVLKGFERDPATPPTWPPLQTRLLFWSALWSIGGAARLWVGRATGAIPIRIVGLCSVAVATIVWIAPATIGYRIFYGEVAGVTPIFNLQTIAGIAVACSLVLAARAIRAGSWPEAPERRTLAMVMLSGVGVIGLWIGSLEIDRYFSPLAERVDNAEDVRLVALSVWWALYGIALVVLGFARPMAGVRYAGLALLGITTLKFLILDLSGTETVWRVVAMVVVGLLLVATSVVYQRVGARALLRPDERGEEL